MKRLCLIAIIAASPAIAQLNPNWAGHGIKMPERPPAMPERAPAMVELEAAEFERFRAKVPVMPLHVQEYWEWRLKIAADYDAGRMSPEAWSAARTAQDTMLQMRAENVNKEAARAADPHVNALRLQQAGDAAARERQKDQMMFELGMRLLFPPQPPRPVVCNTNRVGQTVCW